MNTKAKLVTFGLLPIASAFAGCATQAPGPAYDTLICHRGESMDAPENTMPAYRTAVDRGFGFECDIYLSADKRVFTFHDSTLKRTTDGACTKKCSEANWEKEISKLDVGGWGKWKGSKFSPTRPALLSELLELARDGRYIYVEVKPGPEIVPFIKKVFDAQTKATPRNALFICFNRETCKALKKQMPKYKVYWLTAAKVKKGGKKAPITPEYVLEGLRETGADGVDCQFNPEIVTADFVKKVRDKGYEFHVWTVDDLDLTLKAFKNGVQTVTTNCAKKQLDEFRRTSR
ncbi:MAG: hypothetical protein J6T51_05420 [Kiritimatiellae bacterium]|nr:hypothetical protein [Kiritimatiellia bacterium]